MNLIVGEAVIIQMSQWNFCCMELLLLRCFLLGASSSLGLIATALITLDSLIFVEEEIIIQYLQESFHHNFFESKHND